jgi:predicted nucleic acid-binding protein
MEKKEQIISFFFDTSAIISLAQGDEKLISYSNISPKITLFNLAEIYWIAIEKISEEKANELYKDYENSVLEITEEIIKDGMKFRKENRNKGFSYADSIGYICAKKNNMKFLTTDSQFKGFENVEFVK